ncbi:MAG: class I SAM-dependent methyltransferase [Acidobacteriota bacterium]|nr:MAG: class I SAM-dependent methyltransferase [Acidobacteriota bacterium]
MGSTPELVQRLDLIERLCEGRSVLHLGCTNWPYTKEAIDDGSLLHFRLAEAASELYGFDFDEEGLETLRNAGVLDLYRADLEALDEVDLDRRFDVIVAGEMIEHLTNPGLFLRGIKRFMDRDSRLVITTVNAYCGMRFVQYALRGRGGVAEPVHPDHVAYYSYRTLRLAVEKEGFEVDDFYFYDLGREHRPHNRKVYNLVNDVLVAISKQLSDGVIAVCRTAEDPAGSDV